MGTFLIAFETVLPLFLVIFTGWLFSLTRLATTHWVDILNKYALWIGFPALVVASLMHLEAELKSFLPLILINSGYIVASMFLVFPIARIFRLPEKIKRSLFLILPFGNIAYLGIPVLENAYSEKIMPVAAILAAVYVFWLLTLGIVLVEIHGKESFNTQKLLISLIKNPLLVSVFVGLALVSFNISLPRFAEQTIGLFAQSVTAIVLFSLGIFLGMQKTGNPREWIQVGLICATTMIIFPAIFYLLLHFSPMPSGEMKASILDAAMPLGLTPYALSVQYNLETKLFARTIVLGTTLSIIILPLWIMLLG
jgi:predicted permease